MVVCAVNFSFTIGRLRVQVFKLYLKLELPVVFIKEIVNLGRYLKRSQLEH